MVIIAEGVEGELFSSKISIGYLEIIGENSYHTQYLSPEVAEGFYWRPCFLGSGRTYTKGNPKALATNIPIPIAPVATPATTSAVG